VSARLGIGTATFAPGYGIAAATPAREAAALLLREAIDAGVTYLDTAAAYGDAESIVGGVADLIEARRVRVCTKVSPAVARASELPAAVREALERLRLSSLDSLMLHSVTADVLDDRAIGDAMGRLVDDGVVRRAGASTYGSADALRAVGLPWCGAVQVEHSILNPSVMAAIGHASDTEVVARSVLCKGLLTTRWRDAGPIVGDLAPTLVALERLAADWDYTLTELSIRFALDTPGIDYVIVGVSTPAELEIAMRASTRAPLTPEQRERLVAFDRSSSDATHPERWSSVGATSA
jgi:aryl-alcohol dehydrogenase-like predicted oxidoreductase